MKRTLGELELAVMACLWSENQSMTVRDAVNAMSDEKPRAYTTVMTVMNNLHRKGWLQRTSDGRAFRYTAVTTAAQYTAILMHDELSRATAPHPDVLTALSEMLTPAQHEALSMAMGGTVSRSMPAHRITTH